MNIQLKICSYSFVEVQDLLFRHYLTLIVILFSTVFSIIAVAHGVAEKDQGFLLHNTGVQVAPFMYLGAKHMVTGYDHLLFLTGVIFFLYKLKDVALYVTLFAVGHSLTLLWGVLGDLQADPYLIDAIIGFSVVYKAFENLDGFRTVFGFQPDTKVAVLVFGFFHGFGLATKLQELGLAQDGMITNLISFNIGVELGQFAALAIILIAMNAWRASGRFWRDARITNTVLMAAGFLLIGHQLTGYIIA